MRSRADKASCMEAVGPCARGLAHPWEAFSAGHLVAIVRGCWRLRSICSEVLLAPKPRVCRWEEGPPLGGGWLTPIR